MPVDFLLLAAGVVVLYFGAEWLVRGSASLAAAFNVSPIVVGLTIVSFGTSAPELVVAVMAAIQGEGDLAIGNVLGSNLANVGLILGLTAIFRPLRVAGRVVSREGPIMVLLTLALFPVFLDQHVSRFEGGVLLVFLAGYLWFVFREVKEEPAEVVGEYVEYAKQHFPEVVERDPTSDMFRHGLLVVLGGLGLVIGGHLIVTGATAIAVQFGISDIVIGLTLVAVGTSLPELATTLVAAFRKEADIAVGNIIGSNIFNITAILGSASLVRPLDVTGSVIRLELPAVVLLSLLLLPVLYTKHTVRRLEGVLLLSAYVIIGFILFSAH